MEQPISTNQKGFSQTSDQSTEVYPDPSTSHMVSVHSNQSDYVGVSKQQTSDKSAASYSDPTTNQKTPVKFNQQATVTPELLTNQKMPTKTNQSAAPIDSLTNQNAPFNSHQAATSPESLTLEKGLFNFTNMEASLPSPEPSTNQKTSSITSDQSAPTFVTSQATPNAPDQSGAVTPTGTEINQREDSLMLDQKTGM